MRTRAAVVVMLVGVGLLVAGCTGSPGPGPHPDRSSPAASMSTSASAAATPAAVPSLAVPGRLPSEIARTVASRDVNSITSGDFPKRTHRFYLHLRCTGPAGSRMHYGVLHGDGSPFGPSGDWSCDRTPGVIGDASNRAYIGAVQVQVQPDPGVTTAWAVVSTTAEGG